MNETKRNLEELIDFIDRAFIPFSGIRRIERAYEKRREKDLPDHTLLQKGWVYGNILVMETLKLLPYAYAVYICCKEA